jgi:hypothetical protein
VGASPKAGPHRRCQAAFPFAAGGFRADRVPGDLGEDAPVVPVGCPSQTQGALELAGGGVEGDLGDGLAQLRGHSVGDSGDGDGPIGVDLDVHLGGDEGQVGEDLLLGLWVDVGHDCDRDCDGHGRVGGCGTLWFAGA